MTESGGTAYRPVLVCATCGAAPTTAEGEAEARLTWAMGIEGGRTVWTCATCSRTYLRGMEAKLDSQWW